MFDVIMLANYPPIWYLADFKSDNRTLRLSEFLAFIHRASNCVELLQCKIKTNLEKVAYLDMGQDMNGHLQAGEDMLLSF